jgi:peptidoglycan/xylan/chitin deacetylase (PgdA/CDA1 family)
MSLEIINTIKHRLKLTAFDLNLIKSPVTRSKIVLMYHGIDLNENRKFNSRFFSIDHFEKQLIYFKKNYNLVSLEDLMDNRNLSSDRLNIAITFDDGYLNNFTYAFPLLEKYQIPSHIFITGLNNFNNPIKILWGDLVDITEKFINKNLGLFNSTFKKSKHNGFKDLKKYIRDNKIIGTPQYDEMINVLNEMSSNVIEQENLFDYWRLMSDENIKAIARSNYVKIGSHGYWHNNLSSQPYEEACLELVKSKQYLENLTQYEVNSIGYPDGSYTREVSKYANDIGFKYQCAVTYKFEADRTTPYITDRLGLYPVVTPKFIDHQINTAK